jgi:hypothetical protein
MLSSSGLKLLLRVGRGSVTLRKSVGAPICGLLLDPDGVQGMIVEEMVEERERTNSTLLSRPYSSHVETRATECSVVGRGRCFSNAGVTTLDGCSKHSLTP